jgi:sugar lactone lactonase YvrE
MRKLYIPLLTGILFITACSKKSENTGLNTNGISPDTARVLTFAGNGTPGGLNGTKEQASFNYPTGISIDANGFFFVADKQNNAIRIITPQGAVNTLAGNGTSGFSNTAGSVTFNFPSGTAEDASGNVYVADQSNAAIRKITLQQAVSTFAGGHPGFKNANGTSAAFNSPTGVAVDANGNVYVADAGNNRIRKITPQGDVSTFAGSGGRGSADGDTTTAMFNQPGALAFDAGGNLYVADRGNNLIRKVTPNGVVSTFAGSGAPGAVNGKGAAASFNSPAGITVDANGNVYVGDSNNNLIRKITPDGTVSTYAGTGVAGKANGSPKTATFNSPQGVAIDTFGRLFIADTGNSLIREITP